MSQCYLIDENMPPALADQVRRRQPTISIFTIGDGIAPPKGTLDPDILRWIEQHQAILVTQNRASMPIHLHDHVAAGHHIPGILTLRPKAIFRDIIDDLLLIWEVSESNEYQDQIVYIPL